MKTYQIYIQSTQNWTYVYEIEASTSEEAEKLGLVKHEAGVESNDNWLDSDEIQVFQTIEGSL